MARLEYFLAAESSVVDPRKNTISLFHVLNSVQVEEFPYVLPQADVVCAFIFEPEEIKRHEECQLKVEMHLPGVEESETFRGNLAGEVRFQLFVFSVFNLEIEEAGDLVFRLLKDDVEEASHTVAFSKIEQEAE